MANQFVGTIPQLTVTYAAHTIKRNKTIALIINFPETKAFGNDSYVTIFKWPLFISVTISLTFSQSCSNSLSWKHWSSFSFLWCQSCSRCFWEACTASKLCRTRDLVSSFWEPPLGDSASRPPPPPPSADTRCSNRCPKSKLGLSGHSTKNLQ